ncbi:uncharacterized protein LOC144424379 [Styela clava]
METYISYQVSTKTTRSTFDDSEYKVRRRYQDFIWLRGKLEEANPTHLIPVPGKNMFNQHLMEEDHLMFFSHQEVLSALYISNMDSTTFRTFIQTEFRDDHWAVVRHLLGGIILNPDIGSSLVTNFSPDARRDEKKKILHSSRNACNVIKYTTLQPTNSGLSIRLQSQC